MRRENENNAANKLSSDLSLSSEANFEGALATLRKDGILLEFDNHLPSVASIIAGQPIHGSWWAHPRGREIHSVSRRLTFHREVTVAKLVSKKVTFVHRRLWPAFVAVGSSNQAWQVKDLSRPAKGLLDLVKTTGILRTDQLPTRAGLRKKTIGDAARELETKLLVHSVEIHTESGAHAKQLESWKVWGKRAGISGRRMPSEQAKKEIENVLTKLNQKYGASGKLPWQ